MNMTNYVSEEYFVWILRYKIGNKIS